MENKIIIYYAYSQDTFGNSSCRDADDFFGAEEAFISSTSALSTDFDGELPEGAKYFKIAITPANDTKVEWFEINGYVSQLSVVVNK